jgi:hypothetical protein
VVTDVRKYVKDMSFQDSLDILDYGRITVTKFVTEEELAEMKESDHYNYSVVINSKLEPVVALIEDVDSSFYAKVKDCFKKTEI